MKCKKIFLKFFVLIIALACGLCFSRSVSADAPLAARLLAEPYASTGVRVSVDNFANLRGLANDGTTAYLLNSSGNVMTVTLASLAASSPGSSVSTNGTMHSVSWGSNGGPAKPDLGQLSLAYSHGCLWITNDSNSEGSIRLYCIDVSDYSVTEISVPVDKPLPAGYYYVRSSLIDFPDGRIGKVSAYVDNGDGTYSSTLRTYTVTGTGKNASIAWSQDYVMTDNSNFAVDEHGISTDGTYLYRIQWNSYNPNYKSWTLSGTGVSSIAFSGQYTMPFDNMHFLSHNHTANYYLVGHWDNRNFFITSAADPGPGPGNPLTPTFGTPSYSSNGFTVQVTNYDAAFTWGVSTTAGSVSINGSGLVTVTGLSGDGASATITASTSRSGYPSGSGQKSGTIPDVTAPTFSAISASSPSNTSASVTWTTNEAASTKVVYSVDANYGSSTSETDTSSRVTSHSTSLSGLLACTTYNYKVMSIDASSNTGTSTANTFTTTGCSGGATPSSVSSNSITVSGAGTSTVTDSGRQLTVSTPANFTNAASSVVIQIKGMASDAVLNSISKPSNSLLSAAGKVFEVTALINNSTVLDSFDAEVTISYTYTEADILGLDVNSLRMYHYHNSSWLALNNCSIDVAARKITCTAPSFSIFAIFGTATSGSGLLPAAYRKPMIPTGGLSISLQKISSNAYKVISNANTDVKYIALSTDPEFKNVGLIPYEKNLTWNPCQLSATCSDGTLKVYGKFYTAWGQQSEVVTYQFLSDSALKKKPLANKCPYFSKYVSKGAANSEVKKIKQFLNDFQSAGLNTSQVYDDALAKAIKKFQQSYAAEILTPWGFTKPTGLWYQSTMKKANALMGCYGSVKLDNGKVLP